MKSFATKKWDKRNVWIGPGGVMQVRPALIITGGSPPSQPDNVMFFTSVRNPRTDEILYYMGYTTGDTTYIEMYDESWSGMQTYQVDSPTPSGAANIVFSGDEVGVWSPDWPALYGFIGGPLWPSTVVTSANDINTKTLDEIPTGIAVYWAGRIVVCQDNRVFFSDPLSMRTFVAANSVDPPGGFVYNMHVSQDGYLYLVTSTGVWRLPETAAMSGQIVLGVFEKVTDYVCTGYNQTCVSVGRVFGLTQRGFQIIDEPSGKEIPISDAVMSRSAQYGRMNFSDYRRGVIHSTSWGVVVSIDRFSYWYDVINGFGSWMSMDETEGFESASSLFSFGNAQEVLGTDVFMTKSGLRPFLGNRHDVEDAYGNGGSRCVASIAGRVPSMPSSSPRIRSVTFASDTLHDMAASINGKTRTASPPQIYPVDGGTWDAGVWREPPQRSRDFNFHEKGDEVTVECFVESHPSTVPDSVDVEFGGLGLRRPNR